MENDCIKQQQQYIWGYIIFELKYKVTMYVRRKVNKSKESGLY